MNLLAFDTSTEACSVALATGERLLERFELAPRRHAELLLPMGESLLREAGLGIDELDAVAFGRGPGAFTGVRLAVGVAQGLGLARGLPLVSVSSLAALAHGALEHCALDQALAAIDARMGEIYWAPYELDTGAGVRLLAPEQVCAPHQAPLLPPGDWLGAGSGWASYGTQLRLRIEGGPARVLADAYPRARSIALLGRAAARRGEIVDPAHALPTYLRDRVTG